MCEVKFIIKFREGGAWPVGVNKEGVLIDLMTDEPRVFLSVQEAGRFGELSYKCKAVGFAPFGIYDVIRKD